MSNPSEADVLPGANGGIQPGRYYGRSIPYLPINGYPGKLIAVEGTDGVGRSVRKPSPRERERAVWQNEPTRTRA